MLSRLDRCCILFVIASASGCSDAGDDRDGGAPAGGDSAMAGAHASGGNAGSTGGLSGGATGNNTGGSWGNAGGSESGGSGGQPNKDALIVPETLTLLRLPNDEPGLTMSALTLRAGPSGAELYVALENTSEDLLCSAGISIAAMDETGAELAVAISGLLTPALYRIEGLEGEVDLVTSCVPPGGMALAALLDWSAELDVTSVSHLDYRSPYFLMHAPPINALSVEDVQAHYATDSGSYSGQVRNELDIAITDVNVTIFSLTSAGRPLGFATATYEMPELAAGAAWQFETDAIPLEVDQADGFFVVPAASIDLSGR